MQQYIARDHIDTEHSCGVSKRQNTPARPRLYVASVGDSHFDEKSPPTNVSPSRLLYPGLQLA